MYSSPNLVVVLFVSIVPRYLNRKYFRNIFFSFYFHADFGLVLCSYVQFYQFLLLHQLLCWSAGEFLNYSLVFLVFRKFKGS